MLEIELIEDYYYIVHNRTGLYFKVCYKTKSYARHIWWKLGDSMQDSEDQFLKDHFLPNIDSINVQVD